MRRHAIFSFLILADLVSLAFPPLLENIHRWTDTNERHPVQRIEVENADEDVLPVSLSSPFVVFYLEGETTTTLFIFPNRTDKNKTENVSPEILEKVNSPVVSLSVPGFLSSHKGNYSRKEVAWARKYGGGE